MELVLLSFKYKSFVSGVFDKNKKNRIMSRLICLGMLLLVAAVAIIAAPHEDFSREHVVEVAEECKTEAGATEGQ